MNLYEKLAAISRDVQYLNKDDKVSFGATSYKALSEEKVTSLLRKKMCDHKLVVFPVDQSESRTGNITHVSVRYRIVNTEAPEEFIEVTSCGDGADTQDKGSGKAMTYAFKYMWLRTFMIPTGEDPDKISSAELDQRFAEEAAAAKKTEAKAAAAAAAQVATDKIGNAVCSDCGKPITGYMRRSAEEIYYNSLALYKRPLCAECVKRVAAEEKAGKQNDAE